MLTIVESTYPIRNRASRSRDQGNGLEVLTLSACPGTGKTHLAISISVRAGQAGHCVLFATAAERVDRPASPMPPTRGWL